MKYLIDITDRDLYIGAKVLVSEFGGALYITNIKKFTNKSVVFKNGGYIAKEKAYRRIYIL